ncbi:MULTISPECIES: hypothetical protein [Ramlibacter]|uniref:Uncharacterized protein n=1 Tax=Ramlibacter pinisoli TaxID=2682844 RepID=A0A6N8J1B8_9BURK|nr:MULTISPECIES: hypothetical protein [Ramlibacter]MBA2962127.1 hypothetical protein [Ramlibacter sp. CGMCC 1.13660]MVQ32070.1 hypothetical protein [Ramlibacter pinisoli]
MKESENLADRVNVAIEEGRLVDGQLVHSRTPEDPACTDHWNLITPIPRQAYSCFQAARSSAAITTDLIGRDGESAFWVVAYQAKKVQHRIVLPLAGAFVGSLLAGIPHSSVGLVMHTGLPTPFLEARLSISDDMLSDLREKHNTAVDEGRLIEEHARALAHILAPSSLDPAHGMPRPTTISVSSVLPLEYWNELELTFGA